MPAQRCRRHSIGARHELLVRGPHNERTVAGELAVRMEGQKRVEDRQGAVCSAYKVTGFADRA